MNTSTPIKTQLVPGYFFSPGFYMSYWESQILNQFSSDVILKHNRLKPHREIWQGAILAAMLTKDTGVKHYVGLPANEPADIEVVRLMPTRSPNGKDALCMDHLFCQITRCDLDIGENLIDQIRKKNRPAYQNMSLMVFAEGGNNAVEYQEVAKLLSKETVIHPKEIIIMGWAKMAGDTHLPEGEFSITKIFPSSYQVTVNISDLRSFFRDPAVVTRTGRGISNQIPYLGTIALFAPKIEKTTHD